MLTIKNCSSKLSRGAKKNLVFRFPAVEGMEDIYSRLSSVKADNLFAALMVGYDLAPIASEEEAQKAERFLEYLSRAFEKVCPQQVNNYLHLLEMLIEEYDKKHTVASIKNIPAHRLLKALLEEEGLDQKALVPFCFKSASQVSEFINQKKQRQKLTADQAIKLGKRFHLDPMVFLRSN